MIMNEMRSNQSSLLEYNSYTIIRYTLIFLSALLLLASCSTPSTYVRSGDYTHNQSRAKVEVRKLKHEKARHLANNKPIVRKNTPEVSPHNPKKIATSKPSFSNSIDTRTAVVSYAKKFLGIQYRYGGRDEKGFDCSGFTCHVMKKFNLPIPPTSVTQSKSGRKILWENAQTGDLIFFGRGGSVGHVAIVTQNTGRELFVIHSTSSKGVRIDEIRHNSYWSPRIIGAASYIDLPTARGVVTGQ